MNGSTAVRGPRELILASAGSGKTFRLSSAVIGLLGRGADPSSIFASTFTRKAAGEILDRVLARLARATLEPEEAADLARHASGDVSPPLPADPAFWGDVLLRTLRGLNRLNVSTLDAFFVRTMGSYGHELGLPPGWTIIDEADSDRARTGALEEVLDELDAGARLELVRGLGGGELRRSVSGELERQVDALLAVQRDLDPASPGWKAMDAAVSTRPGDLAGRAAALADRVLGVDVPRTKAGAPDKRWITGVEAIAADIRDLNWDALLTRTLVVSALQDPEPVYYRTPAPPELVDLLGEALELVRIDRAPRLAQRSRALGRLAERYSAVFERRLQERGELRFDDVTRLVAAGSGLTSREDLWFRIDGRIRHVLLDEFQDTSLPQWTALAPLTDGLAARTGGAAVVVADPKQSIYAWRGAAPEVVRHVGERYGLKDERLATSYRSSQVVLDAVNTVFENIAHRRAFDPDLSGSSDVDRRVVESWTADFQRHRAAKDLPGHVVLEAGPREEGRARLRPSLCRFAAERIRALQLSAPGRSVGVLARRNDTVARLIYELRRIGVNASEEGGTPLVDSAAVVSVLALLRLADHPGDTIARYHVSHTPVGAAADCPSPLEAAAALDASRRLRARLYDRGYGPVLADLARRLRAACDAREEARLRQLVELGFRFDLQPRARVDDFVRLCMKERVEAPTGADVRVMTVYRAKGLEFDAVVLPDLEGPLTGGGSRPAFLAHRPESTGPITQVFPYLGKEMRAIFRDLDGLQSAWEAYRAATLRDALSVLYVATTRARYALHLIVEADGDKPGTPRTGARLIRDALAPERAAVEGGILFEDGDPDWSGRVERLGRQGARPAATPETVRLRPDTDRRRMLERIRPSDAGARETQQGGPDFAGDLRRRLALTPSAGRRHGSIVHAWMEALEWIEDGLPDAGRLLVLARRVAPAFTSSDVAELRGWLEDRLDADEVRSALRRPDGPVDLERELPFLRREGDVLVEGVIDRMVIRRDAEGHAVAVDVLDYKTDALQGGDEEAIAVRMAHHAPQLRAYRRAAAAMYGLGEDAARARLVFLSAGVVRDVD